MTFFGDFGICLGLASIGIQITIPQKWIRIIWSSK